MRPGPHWLLLVALLGLAVPMSAQPATDPSAPFELVAAEIVPPVGLDWVNLTVLVRLLDRMKLYDAQCTNLRKARRRGL